MTISAEEKEKLMDLSRERFNEGWENAIEWDNGRNYNTPKLDELNEKMRPLSHINSEETELLIKLDDLWREEFDVLYDLKENAKNEEFEKIWPDILEVYEWEIKIEDSCSEDAEETLMEDSNQAGWWHAKMWLRSLSDKKSDKKEK